MANRWGNNGNSERLYFGGPQNHCRWWLQPWNQKTLTPWKESYDQIRQHIKKQRCYFASKGPSGQGYGFSSSHVWMWELDCEESWAPKNWCFWTVVLEKTLESPLDNKEIQPVILKEISPGCSLEGLMLKLKFQYFGHLMRRADSFEKILMLWRLREEGEGDDRGWDGWMASPTQWTLSLGKLQELVIAGKPGMLQFMGLQRVRHDWASELNWTELNWTELRLLQLSRINSVWGIITLPKFYTVGEQKLSAVHGNWQTF